MNYLGKMHIGLAAEHPELYAAVARGIRELRELSARLSPDSAGAVWAHHMEYADRSTVLADHLEEAVGSAERGRFATSYSTVRVGLEHALTDRLLLLADTYRTRHGKMDPEDYARWRRPFDEGELDEVVEISRSRSGIVTVTRRGHAVRNQDGEVAEMLSPYHLWLDRHDPLSGPPSAQHQLDEGHADPEWLETHSKENREIYEDHLKWSSILDNLVLNELATEIERFRFEVHYRFLSAFTHPTGWGYDTISRHRGQPVQSIRGGDHVLTELTLLYVICVIVIELRSWLEYTSARPIFASAVRSELEAFVTEVCALTHYFWFPPTGPEDWDRIEEANRRFFRSVRDGTPADERVVTDPRTIGDDDVRYYRDPLARLAKMHSPYQELTTGLSAAPPW